MRRAVLHALAVTVLVALAVGGVLLWRVRPWRVAVAVDGHAMTVRELDLRAATAEADARRMGRTVGDVAQLRRQAARKWIVKEIMLAEALAAGVSSTAADEQEALARAEKDFQARGLTSEQYFQEGPLPEDLKRREFREGVLVDKFVQKTIGERLSLAKQMPEGRADAGRFADEFRRQFRALFARHEVKCLDDPVLETVDGVAPARPGDETAGKEKK